VHADANQLELALLNLTMNARDAMDSGAIVIAARAETLAANQVGTLEPGRYVCLSVTDTGKGMDAVTLSRAVEPFFTTKGIGKGTGLGLSTVHGLTEQSGGQFILRSVEGQGTTAELWLPVATGTAGDAAGDAAGQAATAGGSATRKLVVLAVDDDNLVLMNTVTMLEDLGHTVFGATSATQALDILRRERHIDLLLTDQAMPRMTGLELVAAARAEWPNLPVILASGYTDLATGAHGTIPRLGGEE
jgi:CheY-like chemotaxis protein